MGLSQVDDTNLRKIRGFVAGLGAEFGAILMLYGHMAMKANWKDLQKQNLLKCLEEV